MLGLQATGCLMMASDGDELRTQGQAREQRLEHLEAREKEGREALDAKIAKLEEVLDQATKLLKRNSADVGAQVEAMQQQLSKAEGQIAELAHKLDVMNHEMASYRAEMDQKLGSLLTSKGKLDPSQVPADKDAHFQAAYAAYSAGEHEKARALFREYVTRYPQDEKAGDAQYWVGASYVQQNKPASALGEYRRVIADYSKSKAFNVALFGMADAFYRLHACTDAKSAAEALLKRKPSKKLGDRTRDLLKRIKAAKSGYCTS